MDLQVYDKADWQIDNGIAKDQVVEHFKTIFAWLNKNKLLNPKGIEVFEFGIDSEVSLHSELLTDIGCLLMNKYYDTYLKSVEYGKNENTHLLDQYLSELKNSDREGFCKKR